MTTQHYGEAYQRGFNHTVRFLLSRGCGPLDRAMEVAQAAWVRGLERLYQLRDESVVVTWVNTIALNVHRSVRRRDTLFQALPELRGSAGINVAAIELSRVLKRCTPRDRVLLEQQLRGLTAEEMSSIQGISKTAIRIRLLRARRAARLRTLGK